MMSWSILRRLTSQKIVRNCMTRLCCRRYSGGDREVLRSPTPWLMLAPSSFNKGGLADSFKGGQQTVYYNFYDPVEGRIVNLNSKGGKQEQVHGRHMELVGSSHGWLAWFNSDNGNVFLSNPLSGRRIDLPVPPYRPRKVILSCPPDEKECCALVVLFVKDRVAFCRPGRSTTWSNPGTQREQHNILNDELKYYSDFVYSPVHGGFLGIARYHYLSGGCLEYWNVDDPSCPRMVRSSLLGRWDTNTDWFKFEPMHLVSYMDRLFVVRLESKDEIYVYRAYGDSGRLELCCSFDDLAMFVGYNNSLAVKPSYQFPKLKPNFIYTISGRYDYFHSRYDHTYKYTSEDYKDQWLRTWFTPSFD